MNGSQDRLCEICGLKYKLRFADINVRETEGGKYKPDIHPESDYHKNYVKLREKQCLGQEEPSGVFLLNSGFTALLVTPGFRFGMPYRKAQQIRIECEKIIKARSDGDDKAGDKESSQGC